jgi:hypothetical protein
MTRRPKIVSAFVGGLLIASCGPSGGRGSGVFPTPTPEAPVIPPTDTSRLAGLPPDTAPPQDPRYATWPVDRITDAQKTWIPAGTVGPPPGWMIVVEEGDHFIDEIGRRVYGETYYDRKLIRVSRWAAEVNGGRQHGGELPALEWELANAWLGEAGHPELAY